MKTTTAPEAVPAAADPGPPASYLDLYGLSKPPFGGPPGKGSYIPFGSHRRALELLVDHAMNGRGTVLLQGEEGIGKTATLRSIAAAATESGVRTIVVSRPPTGRINAMQLVSALEGQPSASGTTDDDAIAHFLAPPRKVLLADDVDLMPPDCVRLLLSLAQRVPDEPGGPAIVLGCTTSLITDPKRPELSQLVSLASNTIRLPVLSPAEIRQYIEQSLWVAGGTTRRLITPDAIRLLVARSAGVPGITNRLMEAVLTGGFARGDTMISAKTIAATTGPVAPRPHYRAPRSPGKPERVMQVTALGLLLLGAAAFLYRGLSDHPDPGSSAAPKPIAATISPPPQIQDQVPASKPAEILPPALVSALMKRGDQSLGLGDVTAARLLYERAAKAGNAAAATALGKTYDPNFASPGGAADPARARGWYLQAIALGDPGAADLLKRLGDR